MIIRSHRRADRRLERITEYFATDSASSRYGLRVVAALTHGVELLADHPKIGTRFHLRKTPPPPRQFRRLLIEDYAIIHVYLTELDEILVVDYWHQARNQEALIAALGRIRL